MPAYALGGNKAASRSSSSSKNNNASAHEVNETTKPSRNSSTTTRNNTVHVAQKGVPPNFVTEMKGSGSDSPASAPSHDAPQHNGDGISPRSGDVKTVNERPPNVSATVAPSKQAPPPQPVIAAASSSRTSSSSGEIVIPVPSTGATMVGAVAPSQIAPRPQLPASSVPSSVATASTVVAAKPKLPIDLNTLRRSSARADLTAKSSSSPSPSNINNNNNSRINGSSDRAQNSSSLPASSERQQSRSNKANAPPSALPDVQKESSMSSNNSPLPAPPLATSLKAPPEEAHSQGAHARPRLDELHLRQEATPRVIQSRHVVESVSSTGSSSSDGGSIVVHRHLFPEAPTFTISPPHPRGRGKNRALLGGGDAFEVQASSPAAEIPSTVSPNSATRLNQSGRRSLIGARAATNSPDSQPPPLTDMTHAPDSQAGSSWDNSLVDTATTSLTSTDKNGSSTAGAGAAAAENAQANESSSGNVNGGRRATPKAAHRSNANPTSAGAGAGAGGGRLPSSPSGSSSLTRRVRRRVRGITRARLGRLPDGVGSGASVGSVRSVRTAAYREQDTTSETASAVAAVRDGFPVRRPTTQTTSGHRSAPKVHIRSVAQSPSNESHREGEEEAAAATVHDDGTHSRQGAHELANASTARPGDGEQDNGQNDDREAAPAGAKGDHTAQTRSEERKPTSIMATAASPPPILSLNLPVANDAGAAVSKFDQPPPTTRAPMSLSASYPVMREGLLALDRAAASAIRSDPNDEVNGNPNHHHGSSNHTSTTNTAPSNNDVVEVQESLPRHQPSEGEPAVPPPAATAVGEAAVVMTPSNLSNDPGNSASPPPSSTLVTGPSVSTVDQNISTNDRTTPSLHTFSKLEQSPSLPHPVPPHGDLAHAPHGRNGAAEQTPPGRVGEISVPLLTAMLALPTLHAGRGDPLFSSPMGTTANMADFASGSASDYARHPFPFSTTPQLVPEASQEFFVRGAQRMGLGNINNNNNAATTTAAAATVAAHPYPGQNPPSFLVHATEGVQMLDNAAPVDGQAAERGVARRIQLEERDMSASGYKFDIRSTSSAPHPLMALVLDARRLPAAEVVEEAATSAAPPANRNSSSSAAAATGEKSSGSANSGVEVQHGDSERDDPHAQQREGGATMRTKSSDSDSNSSRGSGGSVHTQASLKDERVPPSAEHSVDEDGNLIIYKPPNTIATPEADADDDNSSPPRHPSHPYRLAADLLGISHSSETPAVLSAATTQPSQSPIVEATNVFRALHDAAAAAATSATSHNSINSGDNVGPFLIRTSSSSAAAAAGGAAAPADAALIPPRPYRSPTPLSTDLVPGLLHLPSSTDLSGSSSLAPVHSPNPHLTHLAAAAAATRNTTRTTTTTMTATNTNTNTTTATTAAALLVQRQTHSSSPASPPVSNTAVLLVGDRYRYGSSSTSPIPHAMKLAIHHAGPTPGTTVRDSQLSSSQPSAMQMSSAISGHSMAANSEGESSMWSSSLPPPPPAPPLRFYDLHTLVTPAAAAVAVASPPPVAEAPLAPPPPPPQQQPSTLVEEVSARKLVRTNPGEPELPPRTAEGTVGKSVDDGAGMQGKEVFRADEQQRSAPAAAREAGPDPAEAAKAKDADHAVTTTEASDTPALPAPPPPPTSARVARVVLRARDSSSKKRRHSKLPAPSSVRSASSGKSRSKTTTTTKKTFIAPLHSEEVQAPHSPPQPKPPSHPATPHKQPPPPFKRDAATAAESVQPHVVTTPSPQPQPAPVSAPPSTQPPSSANPLEERQTAPPLSPSTSPSSCREHRSSSTASLISPPQTVEPSRSLQRTSIEPGATSAPPLPPPLATVAPVAVEPQNDLPSSTLGSEKGPTSKSATKAFAADVTLPHSAAVAPPVAFSAAAATSAAGESGGTAAEATGSAQPPPPPPPQVPPLQHDAVVADPAEAAVAAASALTSSSPQHNNRRVPVRTLSAGARGSHAARTAAPSQRDTAAPQRLSAAAPVNVAAAPRRRFSRDVSAIVADDPPHTSANQTTSSATPVALSRYRADPRTSAASSSSFSPRVQELPSTPSPESPPPVTAERRPDRPPVVPHALPLYHIQQGAPQEKGGARQQHTTVSTTPAAKVSAPTSLTVTPFSVSSGLPPPPPQRSPRASSSSFTPVPSPSHVTLSANGLAASPYARAPTYNRPLTWEQDGRRSSASTPRVEGQDNNDYYNTYTEQQVQQQQQPMRGAVQRATRKPAATVAVEQQAKERVGNEVNPVDPPPPTPPLAPAARSPPRRASRLTSSSSVKRTPRGSGAGWTAREAQLVNTPGTDFAPSIIPGTVDSRVSSPETSALLNALGEWTPHHAARQPPQEIVEEAEEEEEEEEAAAAEEVPPRGNVRAAPVADSESDALLTKENVKRGASRRSKKQMRTNRTAATRLRPMREPKGQRRGRSSVSAAAAPAVAATQDNAESSTPRALQEGAEPRDTGGSAPFFPRTGEEEQQQQRRAQNGSPRRSDVAAAAAAQPSRRTAATSPSRPSASHVPLQSWRNDEAKANRRSSLHPSTTAASANASNPSSQAALSHPPRGSNAGVPVTRQSTGSQTDMPFLPRTSLLPPRSTNSSSGSPFTLHRVDSSSTPFSPSAQAGQRSSSRSHSGSPHRRRRSSHPPPQQLSPSALRVSSSSSPPYPRPVDTTAQYGTTATTATTTATSDNVAAATNATRSQLLQQSSPPVTPKRARLPSVPVEGHTAAQLATPPPPQVARSGSLAGSASLADGQVVREVLPDPGNAAATPRMSFQGSPVPSQPSSVPSSCLQVHQRQAGYRSYLPRTLPSLTLTPDPVHGDGGSPTPAVLPRPHSMEATQREERHGRPRQLNADRRGSGSGGVWGKVGALKQKLLPLWFKGRRHGSRTSSSRSSTSSRRSNATDRTPSQRQGGEDRPTSTAPPLTSVAEHPPQPVPRNAPMPPRSYSSPQRLTRSGDFLYAVPRSPDNHDGTEYPQPKQQQQPQQQRSSIPFAPSPSSLPPSLLAQHMPREHRVHPQQSSKLAQTPPPTPSPFPVTPPAPQLHHVLATPSANSAGATPLADAGRATSAMAGQPLQSLQSNASPAVSVSGGSLPGGFGHAVSYGVVGDNNGGRGGVGGNYYGAYQRSLHARLDTTPSRTSYSPLVANVPVRTSPLQPPQKSAPPLSPGGVPRASTRSQDDASVDVSDTAAGVSVRGGQTDYAAPSPTPVRGARNVPFHGLRNRQQPQQLRAVPLSQNYPEELLNYTPREEVMTNEDANDGYVEKQDSNDNATRHRDHVNRVGSNATPHAPQLTKELLDTYQRTHATTSGPASNPLLQPPFSRASPRQRTACESEETPQAYFTNPRYAEQQQQRQKQVQATPQRNYGYVEEVRDSRSPTRQPILSAPSRGWDRPEKYTTPHTEPYPERSSYNHPLYRNYPTQAGDPIAQTKPPRPASPTAAPPSERPMRTRTQPPPPRRSTVHSPSPAPVAPTKTVDPRTTQYRTAYNYPPPPQQQQPQRQPYRPEAVQSTRGGYVKPQQSAGGVFPALSRPVLHPTYPTERPVPQPTPQQQQQPYQSRAEPMFPPTAGTRTPVQGSTPHGTPVVPPALPHLQPASHGNRSSGAGLPGTPLSSSSVPILQSREESERGVAAQQQQQPQRRANSVLRGLRIQKEQRQGRRAGLMR